MSATGGRMHSGIGSGLLLAWATVASAAIHFDVTPMVAVGDVSTAEFQGANPDEKLVEARFAITTFLRPGDDKQPVEVIYYFESPEQTMQVVDYSPKTSLDTPIAGNVGVETQQEKNTNYGVTGGLQYGNVGKLEGTVNGGVKNTSSFHYDLLPPMQLVSASGTMSLGSGAYFKLRTTARTSLEGAREFVLVLRVPRSWRGDVMRIICQSTCQKSGGFRSLDDAKQCGAGSFLVPMYLDGDELAKWSARQFLQSQRRLLEAANAQGQEIARRRHSSVFHEIGSSLSLVPPRIPAEWLTEIVQRPARGTAGAYERYLPQDVRNAAAKYQEAKRHLDLLARATQP